MEKWARASIRAILKSAKEYAYGLKIQSRKGELFEIPVGPIIDIATYDSFREMRTRKKLTLLVVYTITCSVVKL